jgi:hypothetical protein
MAFSPTNNKAIRNTSDSFLISYSTKDRSALNTRVNMKNLTLALGKSRLKRAQILLICKDRTLDIF